jgi:hypothetical protein
MTVHSSPELSIGQTVISSDTGLFRALFFARHNRRFGEAPFAVPADSAGNSSVRSLRRQWQTEPPQLTQDLSDRFAPLKRAALDLILASVPRSFSACNSDYYPLLCLFP